MKMLITTILFLLLSGEASTSQIQPPKDFDFEASVTDVNIPVSKLTGNGVHWNVNHSAEVLVAARPEPPSVYPRSPIYLKIPKAMAATGTVLKVPSANFRKWKLISLEAPRWCVTAGLKFTPTSRRT